MERQCEKCKNIKHDVYGSGRFCSKICAKSYSGSKPHKRKKPNKEYKKECPGCKNEFSTLKKRQETCSRSCAMKLKNRKDPSLARRAGLKSANITNTRSKNEMLFAKLCEEHYSEVLCNKPIFNGWDADVIIPELKIAVLWNGKWHYEKITKNHSLKQVQNRDRIKCIEIKKHGYDCYIIKDMGKFNPSFVEEQFYIFTLSVIQI